jgi:hypothetical protein
MWGWRIQQTRWSSRKAKDPRRNVDYPGTPSRLPAAHTPSRIRKAFPLSEFLNAPTSKEA